MTDPLVGNPKRAAKHSLAGYDYQIWRSVYTWLCLKPEELLFLEGAEDIDKVSGDSADAVQIKFTTNTISLNTKQARKALNDFLEIRDKNPGRDLRYHYCTTAGAAKEQGWPEGRGTGIDMWHLCRQAHDSQDVIELVDLIQSTLESNDDGFSRLKSALAMPAADFLDAVIRPVQWLTAQPTFEEVRQQVLERVIDQAHRKGIPRNVAEGLADSLYSKAMAAAKSCPTAPLKFSDFVEAIDEKAFVTVSRYSSPAAAPSLGLGGDAGAVQLAVAPSPWTTPPDPPPNILKRDDLLHSLVSLIASSRCVVLSGGAGTGKSTLAALACQRLRPPWIWIDAREYADDLAAALRATFRIVSQAPSAVGLVVLDHLPGHASLQAVEQLLGRLYTATTLTEARLLVTTTSERLPATVDQRLGSPAYLSIPNLSEHEVAEHLLAVGCPSGMEVPWTRVVLARTSGHVQLVTAFVESLARRRFPRPAYDDIFESPASVQQHREATRRLLADMLDEDARELLFRITVWTGPFQRQDAIQLGAAEPTIARPGEAFDAVAYTWLQRRSSDYYVVSPLVSDAARETYSESRVGELHLAICNVIMRRKVLSQTEMFALAVHGLAAQDWEAVMWLVSAYFLAPESTKDALAKRLDLLCALGHYDGSLPFQKEGLIGPFRLLQLDIACRSQYSQLADLVTAAERDLSDTSSTGRAASRYSFIWIRLARQEISSTCPMPLARVLKELRELQDGLRDVASLPPAPPALRAYLVPNQRSARDLDALTSVIESSSPREVDYVKEALEDEEDCREMLGIAWASAREDEEPDLEALLQRLRALRDAARSKGMTALVRACARTCALTLDEDLERPEESLEILRTTAEEIGPSAPLSDQLAWTLYRLERYEEALTEWHRVFGPWSASGIIPVCSMRAAGLAALRLARYDEASEWLDRAARLAAGSELKSMAAGLYTDSAATHWRHGSLAAALNRLQAAWSILAHLPEKPTELREIFVRRAFGHTVINMLSPSEAEERPVGHCSHPDLQSTQVDESELPLDVIAAKYATLLARHQSQASELPGLIARIRGSAYPSARFFGFHLALCRAFEDLDLEGIGPLVEGLVLAGASGHEAHNDPFARIELPSALPAHFVELVETLLVSALIAEGSHTTDIAGFLTRWNQAWTPHPLFADMWRGVGAGITRVLTSDGLDSLLRDGQADGLDRVLAALGLVVADEGNPEARFYAHVLLALHAENAPVPLWSSLGTILRRDWRLLCGRQLLLITPTWTVPQITEACASLEGEPRDQVLRIIRAATHAVKTRLPQEVRERLGL